MKKLEALNESLRDVLLVNDEAVEGRKHELEESFKLEKSKLETQVAKMQVKLNESMEKTQELNKKINRFKAAQLLEEKTQDLPAFEARQIKKHFAVASAPEIEKNFNKVLESVKKKAKDNSKDAELALEDEVKKVIDEEQDMNEDDLLKNRAHNNHHDDPKGVVNEDDEYFETSEDVITDEDGNIEIGDDEVIDEATMINWMSRLD